MAKPWLRSRAAVAPAAAHLKSRRLAGLIMEQVDPSREVALLYGSTCGALAATTRTFEYIGFS
jgi:hypothetical protein